MTLWYGISHEKITFTVNETENHCEMNKMHKYYFSIIIMIMIMIMIIILSFIQPG